LVADRKKVCNVVTIKGKKEEKMNDNKIPSENENTEKTLNNFTFPKNSGTKDSLRPQKSLIPTRSWRPVNIVPTLKISGQKTHSK
jgi:hypothetical protein